jgi:FixJ family two-component response regulator
MQRLNNASCASRHVPPIAYRGASHEDAHTNVCPSTVYLAADLSTWEDALIEAGWGIENLTSLDTLQDDLGQKHPHCLIIDISDWDFESSGLLQQLASMGAATPFICITDEVSLAGVVEIVRAGAIDVLPRSEMGQLLLPAIRKALLRSQLAREHLKRDRELRDRYHALSLRERQVMTLACAGLMNKQIAGELAISEITVKAHRGSAMRKMQAHSFAELVKMAMALDL